MFCFLDLLYFDILLKETVFKKTICQCTLKQIPSHLEIHVKIYDNWDSHCSNCEKVVLWLFTWQFNPLPNNVAIKFKFELVLMVESHQTYQLFSLPLVSECVNLKQLLKHFSDSEVKNVILEHIPFRILKNIDIVFSYMWTLQ